MNVDSDDPKDLYPRGRELDGTPQPLEHGQFAKAADAYMASASPELYKATETMLALLEELPTELASPEIQRAAEEARIALAKARGPVLHPANSPLSYSTLPETLPSPTNPAHITQQIPHAATQRRKRPSRRPGLRYLQSRLRHPTRYRGPGRRRMVQVLIRPQVPRHDSLARVGSRHSRAHLSTIQLVRRPHTSEEKTMKFDQSRQDP